MFNLRQLNCCDVSTVPFAGLPGLADLTAYRLSFSYRSQTNAFFILLYVGMDDNGFRHPHSRKPNLLPWVIASVSFEVICLLNENPPPFSNNARNFFFEIDLIMDSPVNSATTPSVDEQRWFAYSIF